VSLVIQLLGYPGLIICRIAGQSSDGSSTPSKREEIQWPALDKLTPGNLKRTMSTMMQEWERSLTPPTEEGKNPLSRSNSAAGSASASTRGSGPSTQDEVVLMSR
jgi:hypothetical protein